MTFQHLLLERDGPVAVVTVNRPKALNALDPTTIAELQQCVDALGADAGVRAAVLTGAGERAFVAGADIAAMERMSAVEALAFARRGQRLMRSIEDLRCPVIAAVNGYALGGGLELAMAADLVLAAETAKFGQPEITLGILPGFGGTQRLARRIGLAAARMIIYGGEMIGAAEAATLGLVNRVVASADLLSEARKLAANLADKAPIALQQAKAALNLAGDVDLETGCRFEAEAFAVAFSSADRREGMRAFLEKRRPEFTGK